MTLNYTQAVPEDAEALCSLYLQYLQELKQYKWDYTLVESGLLGTIQGKIRSRMSLVAVAKHGDRAVAFLFCSISRLSGYTYDGSPLFGYISDTFVLPEFRRHHVAGRLTEMAYQWLKENEVSYVQLEVLESNEAAHQFWGKQGFLPRKRIYGKKIN